MGTSFARWPSHRITAFVLVFATLLSATVHNALAAPPEEVGPEFEEFHRNSGGVRTFGYALSPRVLENERIVQYFERQRMEFHSENEYPWNVLLGRLGSEDASARGLIGTDAFQPLGSADEAGENCLFFEQTGHQVCNGFKSHWQDYGLDLGDSQISERESVALFGYPISREFQDPETGMNVQYFERAVFEYHPENAGTEYEVLQKRTGSPLWNQVRDTAQPAPEPEPEVQTQSVSGAGQHIADLAQQYIGAPYVWGATGPNAFDCSGFVYFIAREAAGVDISRDMFAQAQAGVPVSSDNLQPGDLVFQQNTYKAGLSHAGIYIGGGQFVHAANPGTGVTVSNLWDSYWGSRYYTARRIVD